MENRWQTDNWWVSSHNFDPEVRGKMAPSERVTLHDVTLRDGEECSGLVFSVEDKVAIAEALLALGITRLELGVFTPRGLEAAKRIAQMPFRDGVYICTSPSAKSEFSLALDSGVSGITLIAPSSDVWISTLYDSTRQAMLEETLRGLREAKARGLRVTLFLADTARADLAFLKEMVVAGVGEGADEVGLVDSLSLCHPPAMAYLVSLMKSWVDVPIAVHCHNDYGLATANALAGWSAGASVLHVAVNGIGYRSGNAALEEVALALRALYGAEAGIRYEKLHSLSTLVQQRTGLPVAYNKPVAGEGIFTFERYAGLGKAVSKGVPQAVLPYLPSFVGRHHQIVLSKWSDLAAVENKLAELRLAAPAARLEALLGEVKRLALLEKRPVTDQEFRKMVLARGGAELAT